MRYRGKQKTAIRHEAEILIHTRLLRENTMTWKSKNNQECVVLLKLQLAKMAVYFYFLFQLQVFFLSILDMRLMYFIGKLGIQLFCLYRRANVVLGSLKSRIGQACFLQHFQEKTPSTRQTRRTFTKILLNTLTAARDDHVTGSVKALDGPF